MLRATTSSCGWSARRTSRRSTPASTTPRIGAPTSRSTSTRSRGCATKLQDGGFWGADEGLLVIVDADGSVIGHIEFYKPVDYLDAYELSYLIYDLDARGKGATSEAVRLLTDFLFATKKVNRIQLVIHPDNAASRRIAEKNGYLHEGAQRGAWYNGGRYHDVAVYAVLRAEHEALRELSEK